MDSSQRTRIHVFELQLRFQRFPSLTHMVVGSIPGPLGPEVCTFSTWLLGSVWVLQLSSKHASEVNCELGQ